MPWNDPSACTRFPCGMGTGGCWHADCERHGARPFGRPITWPVAAPVAPVGCICPPTSEQTCGNPVCPRRAPGMVYRAPTGSHTAAALDVEL